MPFEWNGCDTGQMTLISKWGWIIFREAERGRQATREGGTAWWQVSLSQMMQSRNRQKESWLQVKDRSVNKNSGHWFWLHFPCQVTRGRWTQHQLSHAHLLYIAVHVFLILAVLNAFPLSWACRRQEIWEIQLNLEPRWGKTCWYQLRGCNEAMAELLFSAFLTELCVLFALTYLLCF